MNYLINKFNFYSRLLNVDVLKSKYTEDVEICRYGVVDPSHDGLLQ